MSNSVSYSASWGTLNFENRPMNGPEISILTNVFRYMYIKNINVESMSCKMLNTWLISGPIFKTLSSPESWEIALQHLSGTLSARGVWKIVRCVRSLYQFCYKGTYTQFKTLRVKYFTCTSGWTSVLVNQDYLHDIFDMFTFVLLVFFILYPFVIKCTGHKRLIWKLSNLRRVIACIDSKHRNKILIPN